MFKYHKTFYGIKTLTITYKNVHMPKPFFINFFFVLLALLVGCNGGKRGKNTSLPNLIVTYRALSGYGSANERPCYIVKTSLIGWAHTQNDPWHKLIIIGRLQRIGIDIVGYFGHDITYWGKDKMAAILETTFSNSFFCVKIFVFCFKFHLKLFLNVQLTISRHLFK